MAKSDLKKTGLSVAALSLWVSMGISNATAVVSNATVSATIFGSIASSTALNLTFGDLSAGPIPGTVVISANGARTGTGGVSLSGGSASSPATFSLVGIPNATYAVALPTSITITDSGANSMVVDNFNSLPSGTGLLDAGGNQTLTIGGTLSVLANQTMGNYTGVMTITIVYN